MSIRRIPGLDRRATHEGLTSWLTGMFKTSCGIKVETKHTTGTWFASKPSCEMCLAARSSRGL